MNPKNTPPSEGAQHPDGERDHAGWLRRRAAVVRECVPPEPSGGYAWDEWAGRWGARSAVAEYLDASADFIEAQAAEIERLRDDRGFRQARLDAVLTECAALRDESRDDDFDSYDIGYSRACREAAYRIERAGKGES